ncbi:MAG TPA: SxtJ family membrane protein [Thermoanaerobaculia bacterium]|nr:SxtJ family membrane protein [Thermoanaerobaculia bacterium]
MSLAPPHKPPTPFDLKVFGLVLGGLAILLSGLVAWRPQMLFGAAAFLAGGWLVSLVLRPEHRQRWSVGTGLPLTLAAVAGLGELGVSPSYLASAVGLLMTALAAGVLGSPGFGRAVRDGWMEAVAPMGWTVSHLVLGLTWYLVITPIGLVMRLLRRDPLRLERDPAASTYWVDHSMPSEISRYFRQF